MEPNGGFWLKIADIQLHIGTEGWTEISKRHPAFEVVGLLKVKKYLMEKGEKIKEDKKNPGIFRFSIFDYWDNRIELFEKE